MNTEQKARAAAELLENETFRSVMTELRERTMNAWRDTASGSAALRELHWFEIHALDAVEGELKRWIEDAALEAAKAERAQERQKRR